MTTLGGGSGRRTASLGSGTRRTGSLAAGSAGRRSTLVTTSPDLTGGGTGSATGLGVSDFVVSGDRLLQEDNSFLLQENNDRILLEDAVTSAGGTAVADGLGVGSALVDIVGSGTGLATGGGTLETVTADKLLQENNDRLLQEDGTSFILLETGAVIPPTALLDTSGFPILDTTGGYILEP